ncbi:tetratricopeptide repeat protein [Arcobacter sp.]|uniref:tetratricopeptide repeat protein n=1 Tax=unclassified Arcobacter TaxID=2593671 RepID=UPI003B008DB7
MTKLIKILAILALLIFMTGCEEKPIGEKVVIKSTKDMDPRLKAYPEAVEWYKDSDMDKVSAYNLGVIYQNKIKDYYEAISWYKKAISMGYNKATLGLGNSYRNLKDYQNSIKWYLLDDSIDSLFNIGLLYNRELKDYQNAIKYYKLAIERVLNQ